MNQGLSRKWSKVKPTSFSIASRGRQLAEMQRRLALADVAVGVEQHRGRRAPPCCRRSGRACACWRRRARRCGRPARRRARTRRTPRARRRRMSRLRARPGSRGAPAPAALGRVSVIAIVVPPAALGLTAAGGREIVTDLLLTWQWAGMPCRPTSAGSPSSAPATAAPAPGAGTCPRPAPSEVALVGLCDANPARLAVVAEQLGRRGGGGLDRPRRHARGGPAAHARRLHPRRHPCRHHRRRARARASTSSPRSRWRRRPRTAGASSTPRRGPGGGWTSPSTTASRRPRGRSASSSPRGGSATVTSADFHWYLDTSARRRLLPPLARLQAVFRQSLFVHKATHHFDLLNWWIDADPVRVFAQGALRNYGAAGPFRGVALQGLRACRRLRVPPRHRRRPLARGALRGALGRGRLRARRLRLPRGHRHLGHDDRGDPLRQRRAGQLLAQRLHADRGLSPRLQRHRGADRGPDVREAGLRGAARAGRDPRARHRPLGRADRRSSTGRAGTSAAIRCCTAASSCRRATTR